MKNEVDKKERGMRDSETGGRKDARKFFPFQAPHISFKSFPRRSQAGFVWLSVVLLFSLKTRADVVAKAHQAEFKSVDLYIYLLN